MAMAVQMEKVFIFGDERRGLCSMKFEILDLRIDTDAESVGYLETMSGKMHDGHALYLVFSPIRLAREKRAKKSPHTPLGEFGHRGSLLSAL